MILACKGTCPRCPPLSKGRGCSAPVMHPRSGVPGTVASVCVFISRSSQRAAILRKFVQTGTPTSSRKSKLIPPCETRWVD